MGKLGILDGYEGKPHEIESLPKKKRITKQDVKRWTAYTVLSGTVLASTYFIAKDAITPDLENELSVLRGASSYLRTYEGNDPTKALIYAKFSLDAAKSNPNMVGINRLEEEVAKIESDIRTSTNKLVFKPVLDYIASRIEDTAKYNNKGKDDGILGYIGAIFTGIFGYGFYSHGWLKKDKKKVF